MEMGKWLEALQKACRMMNRNPNGRMEQSYLWLTHKRRPKSVGNFEFAHLATADANGWHVTVDVRMGADLKVHELVNINVFPSRGDDANTFAEKADAWLQELESIRGRL